MPRLFHDNVVCLCIIYENIYGINHKFMKYFKESCRLGPYQHFSFKYFLKNAFVGEISAEVVVGSFFKYLEHE